MATYDEREAARYDELSPIIRDPGQQRWVTGLPDPNDPELAKKEKQRAAIARLREGGANNKAKRSDRLVTGAQHGGTVRKRQIGNGTGVLPRPI